jgi:lysozyme
MRLTPDRAEQLLRGDVKRAELGVTSAVSVPLNQGQFDALVSFTYNLGLRALQKNPLLQKLNAGNYTGAAAESRSCRDGRCARRSASR